MPSQTIRKRRGPAEPSESESTTTEVTSSPADDVQAVDKAQTDEIPISKRTPAEILRSESKANREFLGMGLMICIAFIYMIQVTPLPPQGRVYGIMIDAGSTGTRAQVFQFHQDPEHNHLILDSSQMFKIKKSLANLAYGTTGAGNHFFKPLLEKLKNAIPGMRRKMRTPIALRATAGLRLIGTDLAENALTLTREALNKTQYTFREEWVSIISESDEANHGWTTVNYLLGNFDPRKPESETRYVGALELGGASMQMAFKDDGNYKMPEPEEGEAEEEEPFPAYVKKIEVFGKLHTVHSRSFLGSGLFDFTKKLYKVFDGEGVLEEGNPCFRKNKVFREKRLRLGVPGSEEARVVTITGDGDFERCVSSAEIVIGSFSRLEDKRSRLPPKSTFYAFAYFYDRTVKLGLPSKATKEDFVKLGKKLCETDPTIHITKDFDEACAEFSYIYALMKVLTNNFSKEDDIKVHFVQYIDGHMLGWSLGAVLDTVQPHMHEQIALDNEPAFGGVQ